MNVIFLCAGYATRLYPLTKDQPKPLLSVGGKPILNHIVDKLSHIGGLERFYVVTNAKFHRHFTEWAEQQTGTPPITVANDGTTTNDNRLGAIGDLALVVRTYALATDLLIIAGDNLFTADLDAFLEFAAHHRPAASIGVYDVKDRTLARQYGIVTATPAGNVTQFLEKPEEPPSTLASLGVYFLPSESASLLAQYVKEGLNPDAPGHFIRWLALQHQVFAFPFEGIWYDIGDIHSLHKADELLRRELH